MAIENPTAEEWRAVVGYEGFYEVSNRGRIRSLDRIVPGRRGAPPQLRKGRIVRPDVRRLGYAVVMFSVRSVHTREQVHRVVLKAFVGPPLPGQQVDHIDFDPSNNRLSNLRWVTPLQNTRHSIANGRRADFKGERHGGAMLTEEGVREIRRRASTGSKRKELAAEFGVHRSVIDAAVARITWKHVA